MVEMVAMRDAYGRALVDLGERNARVVAVDADLASSSKMGMFAEAFPERFFQMGIAEANMTGVAAGLATMGFIPFTNSFACFATCRTTDQIRVSIAQPRLPVVIGGAYSGLLAGKTGKSHQAIEDMAVMRALPNMTVVAPGDGVEVRKAVFAAAERTGLVVTAEEHNIIGGLGGAVAEVLGENRPTPMKRVGVADVYSESAANDDLLQKYGLTAGHIAQAARSLLERRAAPAQP